MVQKSHIILSKTFHLQKGKPCFYFSKNIMHSQSMKNLFVVTPDWIIQSVSSGKRLNEYAFSLFNSQSTIFSIAILICFYVDSIQGEFTPCESYTPEHVFSKSRFHLMGEIKHDLQDLIAFHYLEANKPSIRLFLLMN